MTVIEKCVAEIDRHHDKLVTYAKNLKEAAQPFLEAYEKQGCEVSDPDLDDEQPFHLTVTLGDIRKLRRALPWRE